MALSDIACKNAKPKERLYKLYDRDGLYLEVTPQGGRYWRMRYKLYSKEKRLSFGPYPSTSLQDARAKTIAARALLKEQIDPAIEKREEKRQAATQAAQTFELVALEWHKENSYKWSAGYAAEIMTRLERDVLPKIGTYPIHRLTAPILYSCIKKIEDRGAKDLARRALQYCGQIIRYAVITGRADRDFTQDMKGTLKKRVQGHFASIEVDELPAFVTTLRNNEVRLYRQTELALWLMMLTFVRTKELIGARWEEINLEKKEWIIPAERMKMRKEHVVPLSKQSIAILEKLQALNGKREFVFPNIAKPGKHMSNNTILKALELLGYKGQMTGHGFRSLALSAIKEKLGYRHEVVDRQLAHVPESKVDKAYDRAKFLTERKVMMQKWADYVDNWK